MNCRNFFNLYQLIFMISILCSVKGDDKKPRTFEYYLNPGCDKCEEFNINIVYIRAVGEKDVLHLLYAGGNFTETLSSIIIRSNNLTSSVAIDWAILTSQNNKSIFDSFKLLGDNHPSIFSVIFTKLYANSSSKTLEWNFNDFKWTLANKTDETNGFTKIEFKSTMLKSDDKFNLFSKNGFISVNFFYSDSLKRNALMPHLQFNSNNTQFSLVLKNLNVSEIKNPKFIFQFALANRQYSEKMELENITSIDDESSPGVFRVFNLYGQDSSAREENRTYVQWKPVCYSMEDKTSLSSILPVESGSLVKLSQDVNSINTTDILIQSLAYIVFRGDLVMGNSSTSLLNITFGGDDKNGYTDYNIWTASFGYGLPPTYPLSMTIIMVICFGLGVPFVVVIAGSIYLIIKKRLQKHRLSYVSIEEHIN